MPLVYRVLEEHLEGEEEWVEEDRRVFVESQEQTEKLVK